MGRHAASISVTICRNPHGRVIVTNEAIHVNEKAQRKLAPFGGYQSI